MKIRNFILVLFFALFILHLMGQDISVRAVIDSGKVLIGDQIRLKLMVEQTGDAYVVSFPDIKKKLSEPMEILSIHNIDSIMGANGKKQISQEIQLAVYDTGRFEIPELSFVIHNGSVTDTLKSLPMDLTIMPVAMDSTIHDIKGIYRMPLTIMEAVEYTIYLIAIVLLGFAVFYYLKRRKRNAVAKTLQLPDEPPYVTALRELQKLADEKPWIHKQVKYFHIQLTDILRKYLEYHFRIQAFEQTTEEILTSLKKNAALNTADLKQLSEILRLADLVKFAKVIPEPSDNADQVNQAINFVNSTCSASRAESLLEATKPANTIMEDKH